jgi:hypothetical protein
MADKKYLSKIVKGSDTLFIKDAEAWQEIADIKTTISGAMHWAGVTTTPLSDGATTNPITIGGESYTAKSGDVAAYGELEFAWNGSKWQEFGSTGSLKALAFKDSASGDFTPAGTNAPSAVTFTGQTSSAFVTGYNDDAVAPSKAADSFTPNTLPSFTEGAFTAASLGEGFYTPGTAPSFVEGAFNQGSLPSLGEATTGNFATEGETSSYNESTETLTLSNATTSAAVTAQGTFNAGALPSKAADTWSAGTMAAIDTTKFNGGSKAADTWSAGTQASFTEGAFNAGSPATLATANAVTAVGTGEAAAQVFSGTTDTVTVS